MGGESSSVGELNEFRGILRLLKRLMKRFCESPHVYFSLDMPSTCSGQGKQAINLINQLDSMQTRSDSPMNGHIVT